ncbi:DUF6783 domain-containing protein [Blautia sp.]
MSANWDSQLTKSLFQTRSRRCERYSRDFFTRYCDSR